MFFSKASDFSQTDYRSRNFKGNWSKHFINDYVDSISSKGLVETLKSFSNHKAKYLPTHLYKFMPPTIYSLTNILQGTVHLSSPRNFNDPFDSYLCVNKETFTKRYVLAELKKKGFIKDVEESKEIITLKEYREINDSHCDGEKKNYYNKSFWLTLYEITNAKSESLKKHCENIYFDAQKICNSKMKFLRNTVYRISCFSYFSEEDELLENSTMWSHYADNHKGFCVKYKLDFSDCKFKELLLCNIFPVNYLSQTEIITDNQLMNLKEIDGELYVEDAVKKKIIKSLLSKSPFWKYEKEWRLILSEKECCFLYENNISFTKIEAIYLGCRIDKSIEQLLIKIGEKYSIKIFRTKQSDIKYSLSCYQLDAKSQASDEYYYKLNKTNSIKDKSERFDIQRYIHDDFYKGHF